MSHDASILRCTGTMLCLVFLLAGCEAPELDGTYGKLRATSGATSVHGTSVLAGMYEAAGHNVSVIHRISPRLSQYQVLVWAPDDFMPPSLEQRLVLEDWLAQGQRTLVYVGRDFDARPGYWQKVLPQLPASQQVEARRRSARAQAHHDRERLTAPHSEFARWFAFERDRPPQRVTQLRSDYGWTRGIDTAKTDLSLEARLLPPTEEAAERDAAQILKPSEALDLELLDPMDLERQKLVPASVDVLLASATDPLVLRVRDQDWATSQILVVANGSFLLNLPLVNREHRKLAGHLIAACGPAAKVGFLETDHSDRGVLLTEPKAEHPTGLEAFTVWPLGFILMHAMLLGLVACFVMFPVFGRPREPASEGVGDFGRHIDALGRLLEGTRDEQYARIQLRHYRSTNPPSSPNS